jgi:hypothetical protein
MSILAQQADVFLLVECNNCRPSGVAQYLEFHGFTVGQGYGFNAEL